MAATLLVLFGFRESDSTWQQEFRKRSNRVLSWRCFSCCRRRGSGQPSWVRKALAKGGGEGAPLVDESKANYAATASV